MAFIVASKTGVAAAAVRCRGFCFIVELKQHRVVALLLLDAGMLPCLFRPDQKRIDKRVRAQLDCNLLILRRNQFAGHNSSRSDRNVGPE